MAGQRRVNGVEAMIVDTTSLSVMVQSIGIPHKDGEKVSYISPTLPDIYSFHITYSKNIIYFMRYLTQHVNKY